MRRKCPVCYGRLDEKETCADCGSTFTSDLAYRIREKGKGLQRMNQPTRRRLYRGIVRELTLAHFPNHRGNWERTIDHEVPISRGFNRGIRAARIGSRENCRKMSLQGNVAKSTRQSERGRQLEERWAAEDGDEMGE